MDFKRVPLKKRRRGQADKLVEALMRMTDGVSGNLIIKGVYFEYHYGVIFIQGTLGYSTKKILVSSVFREALVRGVGVWSKEIQKGLVAFGLKPVAETTKDWLLKLRSKGQ